MYLQLGLQIVTPESALTDSNLSDGQTEFIGTAELDPGPYLASPKPLPPHLQSLIDLLPLNQPVHRSVLEQKYQKSNYARRIRKIVAEYGWYIERFRGKDGANDDWYVRRSDGPVRPQAIRYEVPPGLREIVYKRDNWRCQLCGVPVGAEQGETNPQCDHKIPAQRGGNSKEVNLQTLCTRCNLKKRQSCAACKLPECKSCPFAFPERFDTVVVVRLSRKAAHRIDNIVSRQGITTEVAINEIIEKLE